MVFSPQWRLPFNRFGLNLVEHWQRQYPLLHNFTDARNVVHHRWLRWLGFKFIARRERYGALGLPFLEFVRTSHV